MSTKKVIDEILKSPVDMNFARSDYHYLAEEGGDQAKIINESHPLNCPNCGDQLGPNTAEVECGASEDEKGFRAGINIKIYCSNCGKKFAHTTEYDTREE